MMDPKIALRLALSAALLGTGWGCAMHPETAPWDPAQRTVVAHPPAPAGYLTVETPESGSPDNGEQPHERFFVYDQSGKYVDRFNNNVFLPVGLTPGKYSVVTRYAGQNRKVQVEIRDGCEAYIPLVEFQRAPAVE